MVKNTFFITTAIDYASGNPHLGHAYEKVCADILARWNRNLGKEIFFLTGCDEHGQKIEKKAKAANLEPKQFVDIISAKLKELSKILNLSNDYFIRTTDPSHNKFVQKIIKQIYDNGDIYKDKYSGLYCTDCEKFYSPKELIEEKICPDHKKEVEFIEEESYFFRLSKYQKKLLEFYKKHPEFLSPKSKAQETINRVKEGLSDISISRKNLKWGIPLPFDNTHVIYVWFDALFNYLSAVKTTKKENFWPPNIQIIGKDIMWFHNVYWPAFLISAGYKLPKKIFAHGWWLSNGEKMSKARGNVIEPKKLCVQYGIDEVRYFLISSGSFGDDMNFTKEQFIQKINNELNNDLGNLISRVHAMTQKYFSGKIPKQEKLEKQDTQFIKKLNIFKIFDSHMQDLRFNQAAETLWNAIRETNAYINEKAPWKEQDTKKLATTINILCSAIKLIAEYLNCFIPQTSQKIFSQYNLKQEKTYKFKHILQGHEIGTKENIFKKIEQEPKSETLPKPTEQKEGFGLLNLKVGKIIDAKQHPDAEKLYIETIDFGEKEPRQIVSGIKEYYKTDEIIGKKIIAVTNLKHAKIRGVESQGMVLVAQSKDKKQIGLLECNAKIGTNLKCGKETANNPNQIKIDDFFKTKIKSDGKTITYNGKEILAGKEKIRIDREVKGDVC